MLRQTAGRCGRMHDAPMAAPGLAVRIGAFGLLIRILLLTIAVSRVAVLHRATHHADSSANAARSPPAGEQCLPRRAASGLPPRRSTAPHASLCWLPSPLPLPLHCCCADATLLGGSQVTHPLPLHLQSYIRNLYAACALGRG